MHVFRVQTGATHAGISARANMELSYSQYFARPIFHPVNMERPPSSNHTRDPAHS